MKHDSITFKATISDDYASMITERMIEYNKTHFDRWAENHDDRYKSEPLQIYTFDLSRQLIGGLTARTHSIRAWLEISAIFVDAAWRGQGIGRYLMTQAEIEGKRRGCLYSRLSTSEHQAPRFYEKLGYRLYGKLADIPPGETAYYYYKRLSSKLS